MRIALTSQHWLPDLPARIAGLEDLAENLWWSWHPRARMLFKLLDRQAWKQSRHNPDRMLRDLPGEVMADFQGHLTGQQCTYLGLAAEDRDFAVAYFSAEYGLHRSLPFYAGGLDRDHFRLTAAQSIGERHDGAVSARYFRSTMVCDQICVPASIRQA